MSPAITTRSACSSIAVSTIASREVRKSSRRRARPVWGFIGPWVSRPMCRSAVWTIFISVIRQGDQIAMPAPVREHRVRLAGLLVQRFVDRPYLHNDGHGNRVAEQHRLLLRIQRRQHGSEMGGAAGAGQNRGDV